MFCHQLGCCTSPTVALVRSCRMSAIELMHDNYHYSKENTDCWYTFSKELEPALESTRLAIENKDVYIVSVEDVNDEQE